MFTRTSRQPAPAGSRHSSTALDKLRRWAPLAAALACAVVVEVRARSHEAPAVDARPEVQELDWTADPTLRSVAVAVASHDRPELARGDRVDVYGTDPLTGAIEVVGLDLLVVGVDNDRVVVAAPPESVAAVATRAGFGSFTLVGR